MQRRRLLGASAAILATPLHSIDAFADEPTKLPVIGALRQGRPQRL